MTYERSVIVTGGTISLGYYAALEIAKAHPEYLVVLSSRTDREHAAESINKTLGQENTIFLPLDLSNLKEVRAYAEDWIKKDYPPIQALLLNAALQIHGPVTLTVDGIETTFAITHVGHALLFHLLCPCLAPKARVVVTSSGTHDPVQATGLPKPKYISAEEHAHPTELSASNSGFQRYAESKLANVLWVYALSRRLEQQQQQHVPGGRQITATAFDPGLMPGTGLAREAGRTARFLWTSVLPKLVPLIRCVFANIHHPSESGASLARLAIAEDVQGVTAEYFEGRKPIRSSKDSYDEAKQEDLWQWTVNFLARSDEERERFHKFK
ncbi:hypothetical protein M426DRAFT_320602 [Hypoxylon sp. CI-4A]|nr:hypothetical protein M426DRAFT_320602 [Hypoxylon sp. CI-4A]